jgi:DNA-binding transcriptional LysR family regulator
MIGVLDIVALRSLTAIADTGGFRRAADSLNLSQSAVSQHVRRLERTCGRPLVQRAGSRTRFTADGELLVADARTILAAHDDALQRLRPPGAPETPLVIGSTEHAADVLLPAITARMRISFPERTVRYRIDRGKALNDHLDDGAIDASLFIGEVRGRDAEPAGVLPLAWYAAPGWRRPYGRTCVPLVVIDEPCTIRRRAMQILATHDITTSVVCEAGHLAGVVQAARAGLGVALLAHLGTPPAGLVEVHELPVVDPEPLHVRGRAGAPGSLVAAIATAAASAVGTTLAGTQPPAVALDQASA